ncbi:MAG TPA: magnesium-translocating P-type ATPase [Gemmatimonadales bacterium]|nr:magnesium-translocating P-type ATPase [Gemmatimonadales bacterium]
MGTATAPAGLASAEAARRLAEEGPNQIPRAASRGPLRIFAAQLRSPLVGILIAAAAVSYLLQERIEATVILFIVALNATLGFIQEYHADRSLTALRRYVTRAARVRRDGVLRAVPADEIVRGDLIELEVGDVVPADLELTVADELTADESALTGESTPVAKPPRAVGRMGSIVLTGYGAGLVVATGDRTLFGRTAALLTGRPPETDFERNIRQFSGFLLQLTLGLTLFVFLVNALLGKGWFEALLFALALAVGITPEVLPTIVTVTLARGAIRMARKQVVVKRLISIEDLGNVDVLCCDKTGTLTEGKPALHAAVDTTGAADPAVLLYGALAGSVGAGAAEEPAGNPIDQALWASPAIVQQRAELARWRVLDRNAFDFGRRRSSALVSGGSGPMLLVKGAPESVLQQCTAVGRDRSPLTPAARQPLLEMARAHEAEGFRVLAVAERELDRNVTTERDEQELTLRGFLLFADPPKREARDALAQLAALGVAVKIVTGDSPVITRRICREVGLTTAEQVVTGDELDGLAVEQLQALALDHGAFARVTPEQKVRLVSAMRAAGHVVGFLGDGVNDAPALRAADVGVAVDSGTDVAKEAADVVVLQKSLLILSGGIMEGRTIFANVTKYLLNTMSANLGNMLTVAASSAFLRFLPLLPSQILLTNFLSDVPLLTIAADRVDAELLQRPRRWHFGVIARFMMIFGLLSALFDLLLIGALLTAWGTNIALFRSAWFVESACSEMIVTFAIRTHLPWYRSRPAGWLLTASIAAGAVAFLLPYTTIGGTYFDFVALPPGVAALVVTILVGYFFSAEAAKRLFFRRFEI